MPYDIEKMLNCSLCGLYKTRNRVVPGRGDPTSTFWFVGEAPGREEDETGQAFVGRAGRLLDRCLEKADIDVFYIVNILKCRPPGNRDPKPHEVTVCTRAWLYDQINKHNPRVIVAMGRYSIGFFRRYIWTDIKTMRVTKEVAKPPFKISIGRIVLSTFHPAYLCRNSDAVQGFIRQLHLAKELHRQLTMPDGH